MSGPTYSSVLDWARQQVQVDLQATLEQFDLPQPLYEAVAHAVLLGGKRVRPALVYAATLQSGTIRSNPAARRAAVAIELIHCYSLTHDDLPCMDNDALRRGQPTCHVAYGESTALLAGDVLQSMAFEVLGSRLFGEQTSSDPVITLHQMQILATASSRMVAGQVLDLQAEGRQISQDALETIHRNKTGALIQAAILLGAVTTLPQIDAAYAHLRGFGQALGLAFQVQDDILDITAATEVLGKTAGKDVQTQKSTYPALLGLEAARVYAHDLHQQALQHLAAIEQPTDDLQAIATSLLNRSS